MSPALCFNLRREAAPHATPIRGVPWVTITVFQSQTRSRSTCDAGGRMNALALALQWHLEREELSLESSWEISREPEPLRALLASMCHARSCNPSDWYPSSKARTAVG